MTKFTYYHTVLSAAIMLFFGSINLSGQYDDLYFDETEAESNEEEQDSSTLYIADVDELSSYSETEDTEASDDDEYEDYLDYQGQGFEIDAYGFTNRLSRLRLSGFCLPRRYNYFELLRYASLNPGSRFNAPFIYDSSLAFLSPYAPYRPFVFATGEWVLGCNVTGYDFYRSRENRRNGGNDFNSSYQPRSSQTRRDDMTNTTTGSTRRTTLANGQTRRERSSRPYRTTTYRDRSSSRNSSTASSYSNSNNNSGGSTSTSSGSTTSSTSTRATRRP